MEDDGGERLWPDDDDDDSMITVMAQLSCCHCHETAVTMVKWWARVRETARMRGAIERTRQQGQGCQDKNESTTAQRARLCTVLLCPHPEGG